MWTKFEPRSYIVIVLVHLLGKQIAGSWVEYKVAGFLVILLTRMMSYFRLGMGKG